MEGGSVTWPGFNSQRAVLRASGVSTVCGAIQERHRREAVANMLEDVTGDAEMKSTAYTP